jgi:hypothetical protein
VDTELEAAQRQVPAEDVIVMPVRGPKKKRRNDRKLAAERRRQMKEPSQNQDGCLKQETVTRRGTSRRAEVAWQTKETGRKMSGRPRIAWRKRSVGRSCIRSKDEERIRRLRERRKKGNKEHRLQTAVTSGEKVSTKNAIGSVDQDSDRT